MGVDESGVPSGFKFPAGYKPPPGSKIEVRVTVIPPGSHLSDSGKVPGAASGLTHADGTNKLTGPPISFPVESGERSRDRTRREQGPPGTKGGRGLTTAQQLSLVAVDAAIPVVLQLVVVPAASRGISKVAEWLRSGTRRAPDDAGRPELEDAASGEVAVVAEETAVVGVSAAEYGQHLLRMLIAEQVARSEWEFLSNARIKDDDIDPQLARALRLVLEGDWSMLDAVELDRVSRFLEGTRTSDGQYELMRIEPPELPPPSEED